MSEEIIRYLKNSIDEKGNYCYSLPVETTKAIIKELDRLNNNLKELSDFAIKIYQKELDKTSDWWLQEELKTSFDDINLSTNFRLEEALKENNK